MKRYVNCVRNLAGWASFWPQYYALKREGGAAREIEIPLRGGLIALVPGTLMSAFDEVFLREVYARSLRPPLAKAPVVVDVGANAGFFALHVLARRPDARVVALEPVPSHAGLLRRQVARNPGLRLIIDERAVCARSGAMTMHIDRASEYSVAASTFARGEADASICVRAVTLAEVFIEHGIERCDLLKLDCEGSEYEILHTCPDRVFAATDRIVLEAHAWGDTQGGVPALVKLLSDRGYRVHNRNDEILTCTR